MYTDSGVENLAAAIYKQAAKDYKRALYSRGKWGKAEAMQIKDFLTSGAYGVKREIGEMICKNIENGIEIVGGE